MRLGESDTHQLQQYALHHHLIIMSKTAATSSYIMEHGRYTLYDADFFTVGKCIIKRAPNRLLTTLIGCAISHSKPSNGRRIDDTWRTEYHRRSGSYLLSGANTITTMVLCGGCRKYCPPALLVYPASHFEENPACGQ